MSSSWSPFRTHVKKAATEQLAITQGKGTRRIVFLWSTLMVKFYIFYSISKKSFKKKKTFLKNNL